jgi:hypothetical protein
MNGQSENVTPATIDFVDIFCALKLTADDTVSVDHSTEGAETDIDVSWEVIEWDTGGAPAPTRRVMVIS